MYRIFLIALITLGLNCNAQVPRMDYAKDFNLKGNVKTVMRYQYKHKVENGNIIKDERIINETIDLIDNYLSFGKRGRLTNTGLIDQNNKIIVKSEIKHYKNDSIKKEIFYDPDTGKKFRFCTYSYDKNGNLTKSTEKYTHGDNLSFTTRYRYNNKRQIIEELTKTINHRTTHKRIFSYNENGLVNSIIEYDTNNAIVKKQLYRYNSNNKIEELCIYNNDKDINKTYNYKYLELGQVEVCIYDPKGVKILQFTNQVDEQGRYLRKYKLNSRADGIKGFDTYIYDNKGRLIERKHYEVNGKLISKRSYDEFGNEIRYESYKDNGEISSIQSTKFDKNNNPTQIKSISIALKYEYETNYTYEYDLYGNWIKQIELNGSKPVKIFERYISYY